MIHHKKQISKRFRIIILIIITWCPIDVALKIKALNLKMTGLLTQIGAESAWRTQHCSVQMLQLNGGQLRTTMRTETGESDKSILLCAYQVDVIVFVPIVTG